MDKQWSAEQLVTSFALSIVFLIAGTSARAQVLMTKTGEVSFHSHTWLENIDAVNKKVNAVIDLSKKNIAFSMYMKEFSFEKKLMQEHFNENYVESEKFPKSTFSGTYSGNINTAQNGSYPVTVKGKLNLHGVTKEMEVPATITIANGVIMGSSTFKLNPKDFNISIPFIVRDKIEKENTVKVKVNWQTKN